MSYDYDLRYDHFNPASGVHTEMCIDTIQNYGWFERYRMGKKEDHYMSEGGLWFVQHKYSGIELLDYDGVYELPKDLAFMLKFAGVYVDPIFTE
jgi:hypothetical protein